MKIIFVRFLTHEDVKIGISLNTFEESENCLPVDNVFLGFSTKTLFNQKLENGNIDQQQSMKCLTGTQPFCQSALVYALTKMNMN